MAALEFTPEVTRTVLEGVNPRMPTGPDGIHLSLVKIPASVLAVPIAGDAFILNKRENTPP